METQEIFVPIERVGVLIGRKGHTRKLIERLLKVKLIIDSKTGRVEVQENPDCKAIDALMASNVIRAIGLGFSEEKAMNLTSDSYYIESIDLEEVTDKNRKMIEKINSRLIGRNGSVREKIEALSKCYISVYDNKVSILGLLDEIEKAKKAVTMIVQGKNIESAFKAIQRKEKFDFEF